MGECLATDCYQLYELGSLELYKSVTVNEDSSEAGNAALKENPEVREEVSAESGTEQMDFAEDWSQKWILIENSS